MYSIAKETDCIFKVIILYIWLLKITYLAKSSSVYILLRHIKISCLDYHLIFWRISVSQSVSFYYFPSYWTLLNSLAWTECDFHWKLWENHCCILTLLNADWTQDRIKLRLQPTCRKCLSEDRDFNPICNSCESHNLSALNTPFIPSELPMAL